MSIYKKYNIWHVYFIILGICFAVMLALICYLWNKKQEQYLFEQTTHIELLSNSVKVYFKGQEALLDTLGQQLTKGRLPKRTQNSKTLDRIIQYNHDISAVLLTDIKGNEKLISSNIKKTNFLNVIKDDIYKSHFRHIIKRDKIFIAKTTYFNRNNNDIYIIPLAKSIFDKNNNPIAIIMAGIYLKNTLLENETIQLGSFHHVSILTDNLDYLYTSSGSLSDSQHQWKKKKLDNLLNNNNPILKLNLIQLIKAGLGMNMEQRQVVSRFDPYTELWFISYIENAHIIKDFSSSLIITVSLFAVFAFILYCAIHCISENKTTSQKILLQQTTHDPLTNLPNGTFLRERFESWVSGRNKKIPFSLLYIDIDSFKSVNDSYGHEYGDRVLIKVAERLEKLRKNDELLVRQSGDEFIYLSKMVDRAFLKELADDILYSLSLPYNINNNSFLLGGCIGIAHYPENGTSLDELLFSADIALRDAKKQLNTASYFTNEMQSDHLYKLKMEQRLRKAIKEQIPYVVYQPQVDSEGELYGVEVLVRWTDDLLGNVSPAQFVSVAELSGLMVILGNLIIDKSLRELSRIQKTRSSLFQISINISVRQFTEEHFVKNLLHKIELFDLKHSLITLEITENLFIEDLDKMRPICDQLRMHGIKISLDDFGTGYSSLSMLRELKIDELKIDKSFVDNIQTDEQSLTMVKNIIAIGKNYDMIVLAEGVENFEQKEILTNCACDVFQGYHFSKPLLNYELANYLDSYRFNSQIIDFKRSKTS